MTRALTSAPPLNNRSSVPFEGLGLAYMSAQEKLSLVSHQRDHTEAALLGQRADCKDSVQPRQAAHNQETAACMWSRDWDAMNHRINELVDANASSSELALACFFY